jgi:heavy metal sensor kinase
MNRLSSVRVRFTLFYGAALIFTLLLFAGGIYLYVQNTLIGQINNHLRKDLETVSDYLKHDIPSLHKLARLGPVDHFRVRDGNSPLIASQDWEKTAIDPYLAEGNPAPSPRTITAPDKRIYRVQSRIEAIDSKLYQIVVAHEETGYRRTLKALGLVIALILPILSLSSLLVGYMISGRVLTPISSITAKAQSISADNLSERLPVGDNDNEFSRLATVFNQTFTRLEGSFERLRRFTSDASHELRTPLTAIRSTGETALQHQNISQDCREVIGSMLEETDRLVQTVESLLLLSRADSDAIQKEPVELGDLLADVIEFLSVLAEEKHQQVVFERNCSHRLMADPCMLRRAFLNLVDNAIKYSPSETLITVRLFADNNSNSVVKISDQGPGIPEQDKERIFDRFYRLDSGRSRDNGGTGLGLSITKSAVEAHGGTITSLENPGGGTVFIVRFPQQNITENNLQ